MGVTRYGWRAQLRSRHPARVTCRETINKSNIYCIFSTVPERSEAGSFRQSGTRATHLLRHVLHLGQPVFHSQLRLLIVHVQRGLVRKIRNRRGVDVGYAPQWMLGEDVTAARPAVLAVTRRILGEAADLFRPFRDAHRFRRP